MIFLISVGSLILHLAVSGNYELHRDAYLYLNYSSHPAWGYISVPPFIMVISTIAVKILGGSTFVIRLFPALAGAITTAYVGTLTKDLGGKRWAVLLATLTYALSPAFLRTGSLFQPVAFNQMFWFIFYYFFVQMLRTKNLNYWYLIALVTGIGMLNKYTMAIPMITTILGLLVSQRFSTLFCRQFWIGLLGVFVLSFPNLLWQYNHNWPVFYHLAELQRTQLVHIDGLHFSNMQFLMNSHGIIIWLLGLLAFFMYKPFKPYRPIGVSFLLMWGLLLIVGAKPYYMLGVYPVLFVFGALIIVFKTKKVTWVRPIVTSFVALVALFLLPLSIPFFKAHTMVKYGAIMQSWGIVSPYRWEDNTYHPLPQDFADMSGWKDWAALVKDGYESLSPEEQSRTVIFGDNYGLVGAVNYYNRKSDMPESFSFEGSYMFWAPEELPQNCVMIFLNEPPKELKEYFSFSEKFGTLNSEYARENGAEVYILKNPNAELRKDYKKLRLKTLQPFYRRKL